VFSPRVPFVTAGLFILQKDNGQVTLVGKPREGGTMMNWKSKLALGILTAVAMYLLTFLLPRGGTLRDTALVQFPLTVGVWAIFVLLFVKLK
jgi:hypothetical protein